MFPEREAWPIHDLKHAEIAIAYMKQGKGDRADYPQIVSAIKKRYPELGDEITSLGESGGPVFTDAQRTNLKALTEISAEPLSRAKERMAAALKRGGTGELVSATEKRLKAIKDSDKLQGIADAVDSLLSDWPMLFSPEDRKRLEALRDQAKKKAGV